MKSYKVLLFLLSVIAMLAGLCSFFPSEGVRLGPWDLEFPSLEDVLVPDGAEEEKEVLSPEELIAERFESIRSVERAQYLEFFSTSPTRFQFPDDDYQMLDSLFIAFENSANEPVRVVHYGDSQIEIDRLTFTLRKFLQDRFGGSGPGILPLRKEYYSLSSSVISTKELSRAMPYASGGQRAKDGLYGPMAQVARLDSTVTVTIGALGTNKSRSSHFDKVTILAGKIRSRLHVRYNGETREIEDDSSSVMTRIVLDVPDSSKRVSFTLSGYSDIYGIMLDGNAGVSVDNVAMRGSSGTVFTSMNRSQLSDYFSSTNTRLVILQYGGNTVPYTKTDKQISDYMDGLRKQIKLIKSVAPQASVIFIGPSDMATSINGKMTSYPVLEKMIPAIRDMVLEEGCIFWDLCEAMGGFGSMVRWVNSNPPLAGSDHVHFTPRGAESMGDILCNSLMLYYDYFEWRREERRANQEFLDSLMNVPAIKSEAVL